MIKSFISIKNAIIYLSFLFTKTKASKLIV